MNAAANPVLSVAARHEHMSLAAGFSRRALACGWCTLPPLVALGHKTCLRGFHPKSPDASFGRARLAPPLLAGEGDGG